MLRYTYAAQAQALKGMTSELPRTITFCRHAEHPPHQSLKTDYCSFNFKNTNDGKAGTRQFVPQ